MPNQRYKKFPSSGPSRAKAGERHDNVGPIKTKNWPSVPGKTGNAFAGATSGFKKVKGGAKTEGIC